MDDALRQQLLQIKSLKDVRCEINGFKGELEPYQRVGVAFCVLARRLILGDPCGSGKTVMSIASDMKLREIGDIRRSLVVCLSDKRRDWQQEYKQFSNIFPYVIDGPKELRTRQWLEASTDTGVTIASYEQVRADMLVREKDDFGHRQSSPSGLLKHLNYDLIIFDEASVFKTWETALADSLRQLIIQCKPLAVIAATAYPIEKHLEDIASIYDKVVPELFPDYADFINTYVRRRWISRNRGGFWKIEGYNNQEELSQLLAPYYIGRTRDEIFGQRTKRIRKVRTVSLTKRQQSKYEQLQASVSAGATRQNMLQVYQQMERIVDTLAWFDPNDHSSSKIDDLMQLLTGELADEKVLIFSKYHKPLEELRLQLQAQNIQYVDYTGREDNDTRIKNIDSFNTDPAIRAALVTLAAEKGKNFYGAHYIIFINHVVNNAKIDQLIGRIDRGKAQTSDFICSIHYITRDTFEEDVLSKLERERGLAQSIFGGGNDFIELLSDDQLYHLIKYGKLQTN